MGHSSVAVNRTTEPQHLRVEESMKELKEDKSTVFQKGRRAEFHRRVRELWYLIARTARESSWPGAVWTLQRAVCWRWELDSCEREVTSWVNGRQRRWQWFLLLLFVEEAWIPRTNDCPGLGIAG